MAHPTPRILVVEDEDKTRASLAEGLELEKWTVSPAATAAEAIRLLENAAFDLIVLDWMLPDREGLEVLYHTRKRSLHVPVLMLTARGTLNDRIIGLDSGADDYLTKPFAFAELLARCRALLRRPKWSPAAILRHGDYELDARARTVRHAKVEVPLTPREVDILEYLFRHQGQIVTREMLEREVWKQTQRMTSLDNVIDVQMMRLRRKLDAEAGERLIQTIRGVGYRLGKEAE